MVCRRLSVNLFFLVLFMSSPSDFWCAFSASSTALAISSWMECSGEDAGCVSFLCVLLLTPQFKIGDARNGRKHAKHFKYGVNTTQYTNMNNTVTGGMQTNKIVCEYSNVASLPTGSEYLVISHDNADMCCDTLLVALNTDTMLRKSRGHGTFKVATMATTCMCVNKIRFKVEWIALVFTCVLFVTLFNFKKINTAMTNIKPPITPTMKYRAFFEEGHSWHSAAAMAVWAYPGRQVWHNLVVKVRKGEKKRREEKVNYMFHFLNYVTTTGDD